MSYLARGILISGPNRRLPSGGFRKAPTAEAQRGVVLLLTMLLLVVAASYVLVTKLNVAATSTYRDDQTATALAAAKQALIAYAVTYADRSAGRHGFLPCPDLPDVAQEGDEAANCGIRYANSLGRLPWRTLGIAPLRDAAGECLWYAVAGSYKAAPPSEMLNDDTLGQFQLLASDGVSVVAGATPGSMPVAVIIAPGSVVGNQDRSLAGPGTPPAICGGTVTASQYLDNAAGIDNATVPNVADAVAQLRDGIVRGAAGATIGNDQMTFITRDDVFDAVHRRNDFEASMQNLTNAVATCLAGTLRRPANVKFLPPADYRNTSDYASNPVLMAGRVPDVSTCLAPPQDTLWRHWKDHFFYSVAPTCLGSGTCLTVDGANPSAGVVFFSGRRTNAQTRPPSATDTDATIVANYLDGPNGAAPGFPNASGDANYLSAFPAATSDSDDVLYCIDPAGAVSQC